MVSIKALIIVFGLFVILMAGSLALRPENLTEFLLRQAGKTWLQVLAAAVRIAIGVALILYAPESRFPHALLVIGWIAVVAGVILALVPPAKFQSLIRWAFERFARYTRIAALAAMIFGLFLIYATL
jgi:hypothetical protein